jgi:4-amino-4-deoxy-L-arabinose transferase-like glycosyltransferase
MKKSLGLKLLIFFLVFRLLLVGVTMMNPTGCVLPDSLEYLDLAETLRAKGRYTSQASADKDLLRPPGYPVFLATIQMLAGSNSAPVTLVQLVLSSLISWFLLLIGHVLGRPRVGIVAAWLHALSPNVALWSLTIMTETLFSFLLTAAVLFWLIHLESSKLHWLVMAGVGLGLASLVRPIGAYLVPLVAILTLILHWREAGSRKAIGFSTILLLGGMAILIPWGMRNWRVHGQFALSTVTRKTFVGFNLAYVLADVEGISRDEAVSELAEREDLLSLTFEILRQHPLEFVKTQIFGIARSLMGSETGTWSNVLGWRTWQGFGLLTRLFRGRVEEGMGGSTPISVDSEMFGLYVIYVYGLLHSAVLLGLQFPAVTWLRSRNRKDVEFLILVIVSVLYLLVIPGAAGQARFRVPAEPGLAILASYGWLALSTRLFSKRHAVD